MKTPILGGNYVAASTNAADDLMINMFPEPIPEGGKEPAFLQRSPGVTTVGYPIDGGGGSFPSTSGCRGMISTYDLSSSGSPNRLYVVLGDTNGTVYYTENNFSWTPLVGTVNGTDSVVMASSGTQVFIATSAGSGYIVDIATDTLTQITDADFPGSKYVTYIQGYFVFCTGEDQNVWCTDLLDGLSINPLNFASAESSPDPVVAVYNVNNELWVFGLRTTEVWANTGGAGFPFAPIQGAAINIGCVTGLSVSSIGSNVFWLGMDVTGGSAVYMSNGYNAQRVSTYSIEWQINSTSGAIPGPPFTNTNKEPYSFAYTQNGHSFYVLVLPATDYAFVYDVTTQTWHLRTGDTNHEGFFLRGCAYYSVTNAYQTVVVGSKYDSNFLNLSPAIYCNSYYASDGELYTYNVEVKRRWRALAPGLNNLNRTAQHSLQLDCETGTAHYTISPSPVMYLRWSDDGGHSWSNYRSVSMGANGEKIRVIWRRLGMTMKLRDRVYEISTSDAVKIAIMGAELHMSPTNA